MSDLYPIGDVSRRTGLPVSAIRYYADAGLVTPSGHTGAGYRLFDIRAVARLELVRTLRDLGTGLDDIRRLLAAETTLHDLATAHLAIVEGEMRRFRARRAVLRTIVREGSGPAQVSLMHKLASMSDDDRDHLIDDFWTSVTEGLDLPAPARPSLPPDPTSAQLEAWIELAGTVTDPDFRQAVRAYFRETFGLEATPLGDAGSAGADSGAVGPGGAGDRDDRWTEEETAEQVAILNEARAARNAGLSPGSPEARALATRFLTVIGGGLPAAEVRRQVVGVDPEVQVGRHAELLGRYHALVATINGTPLPDLTAPGTTWLHQAIEAMN